MVSLYVIYEVKSEELETVLGAIKTFLGAITEHEPQTIYQAYQTEEPTKFMHIMHFANEAARDAHSKASYTNDFVAILYPRCSVQPTFTPITELGKT